MRVELHCDCFVSIGKIEFPKQCEWEFVDGKECPKVQSETFDWECNPYSGQQCPQWDLLKNKKLESLEEKTEVTPSAEVTVNSLRAKPTHKQDPGLFMTLL